MFDIVFDILGLSNYRLFHLAAPGFANQIYSSKGWCNDTAKKILPSGKKSN
jgi:hypothetical protein